MKFVETSIFTKQVLEQMSDEAYRALQTALLIKPDAGALIQNSGGLRKPRWKLPGRGKRSALRVIYYLDLPDTIFMIFLYRKTRQSDLTQDQLKRLSLLVREHLK